MPTRSPARTPRRRDLRDEPLQAWLSQVGRQGLWAIVWVVALTLAGWLVSPDMIWRPAYQAGQIATRPIVARASFNAVDEEATQRKRAARRDTEPSVYVPNVVYFDQLEKKLLSLGQLAADPSIKSLDDIAPEIRQTLGLTAQSFTALQRYVADRPAGSWEQLVVDFMNGLASIPLLSQQDFQREIASDQLAATISILQPYQQRELLRQDETLLSVEGGLSSFETRVRKLTSFPPVLRDAIVHLVMQDPQPLYLFDKETTERRREQAARRAEPVTHTLMVHEVLIPAGKQITSTDVQLLRQEQQAYLASLPTWAREAIHLGHVGLLLLVVVGMWVYIRSYKPRIVENPLRGLALTVLLAGCIALAVWGTAAAPSYTYALAVFPVLIVAIVLAIAYEQRLALGLGMAHALLVALTLGARVGFLLVLLVGVAVAVIQLRDVRTRSKMIWVGLWTGLAMAAATWLTGLLERPLYLTLPVSQLELILWDSVTVFVTGLATGLLIQGALPAIESTFGVTTSMTLKELNDASHPLIRRLAQEAPGTYQHSLRLADLTEAAANAIGANGLLCKVGAMYHDVGKINKPGYFVENQAEGPNRHEKLSPAMSLLIIVGHVKDGVELAREYGIPATLRHFIESHHGTTLVEYFYHAARQRSDLHNTPAPTEFEFRYPGPKPQTREAAILMLCDAGESAARTLAEPTPIRLEQLIHQIAQKRLMDGQLDDCNMTLRELHLIEQAITKTLAATYHGRVKYPEKAEPVRVA